MIRLQASLILIVNTRKAFLLLKKIVLNAAALSTTMSSPNFLVHKLRLSLDQESGSLVYVMVEEQ